ncbi:MAG: hypothetical protein B7Y25_07390 [Alphaproteobacteria bacterium 16-39-46]|nr:MAG: hypothetical protein B7Y25_07390 [Alphaproteobacteria bacterium 16-39-46]OZA41695.1 MAG: hypothetical protein B7X84_07570 [Alphaproteobacteria bacterium 17-39-52]HQS84736.1 type IV secretion system protein [Alphaproteobacteria bacterium]HQS94548.1 type IV secretion system protein [Alphaproteobacteria bacterium]
MKSTPHVFTEESSEDSPREHAYGHAFQRPAQTSWGRRILLKVNLLTFFKRGFSSKGYAKSQILGEASFKERSPELITQGRLIDTNHSYRAFAWVSRILGFGFVSSILVNIIFALLCLNLFPLKRVEPLLLTVSPKSDQVVRIEPFDAETNGFDVMTESLARDYVKMRELIDFQTETERWERVYWLSTPSVFETFKNIMQTSGNQSSGQGVYEKRKLDNVTRSLSITSVSTLSKDPRILQVEWQSVDAEGGLEIKRTRWISTLTIQYVASTVKFEDRYMNPLGFVVVSYGVSEKQGEGAKQ